MGFYDSFLAYNAANGLEPYRSTNQIVHDFTLKFSNVFYLKPGEFLDFAQIMDPGRIDVT